MGDDHHGEDEATPDNLLHLEGWMDGTGVIDAVGHIRVVNDYLGTNPGGTLGTAQANPCCWLTPIGS